MVLGPVWEDSAFGCIVSWCTTWDTNIGSWFEKEISFFEEPGTQVQGEHGTQEGTHWFHDVQKSLDAK